MPARTPTSPASPAWLRAVGDVPDHYHGLNWNNSVLPNNYLFFHRQDPKEMRPAGVTHSIHQRHELVLTYQGLGHACVENQFYELAPGTALLLRPGTFHHYFGFTPRRFSWLFFTFDLAPDSPLMAAAGQPRLLSPQDLQQVAAAGLAYSKRHLDAYPRFEIALTMGHLLRDLASRPPLAPITPDSADAESCHMLRQLTHFIDQRMDQALRIDDLALHLSVSESNLRKLFRERFGVSLGHYLRRSRLNRSVQLIHRTDLSISEIARLCGFESVYSFSQAFRRALGMPPSAYRRHLDEGKTPLTLSLNREAS